MFWTSFMLTDYHVLLHIYVPYGPHGWFSSGKIGIFHSPWGLATRPPAVPPLPAHADLPVPALGISCEVWEISFKLWEKFWTEAQTLRNSKALSRPTPNLPLAYSRLWCQAVRLQSPMQCFAEVEGHIWICTSSAGSLEIPENATNRQS